MCLWGGYRVFVKGEAILVNRESGQLKDYKFFCFNGKVECFKVDFDRFTNHHANYYDVDGNLFPFGETNFPPDYNRKIALPDNLSEMVEKAECLAFGIPFVRVDFYNVNGHIYFGEITFYPSGGCGNFTSSEWENRLGNLIELKL